jgi:hypothetical protein
MSATTVTAPRVFALTRPGAPINSKYPQRAGSVEKVGSCGTTSVANVGGRPPAAEDDAREPKRPLERSYRLSGASAKL